MYKRCMGACRGSAVRAAKGLLKGFASGCVAVGFVWSTGAQAEDAKVDFAKEIQPILKERCYTCHGADKQKAKLRLDSNEAILKGGENGPIIVAGKPAESPMCKRVSLPKDDADIMPPKGDPLTKEQVALIAKWIEQGAVFAAAAPAAEPAPAAAPAPAPAADAAKTNEQQAQELFATQIKPVFEQRCYQCHGAEKQKAKLRLDSAEAILKGGENGPIIVAGKPAESALSKRVSLPAEDTDVMPPKGETLTKEQVAAIAKWIELGAAYPVVVAAATPAPAPEAAAAAAAPSAPTGATLLDELAKSVQPAPIEAIDGLRKGGVLVLPIDMKSPLLQVNFQVAGTEIGDAQLTQLASVSDQVTWLNIAGTKVTDGGLAEVGKLKNLTSLHLEKTGVTDAGLGQLKTLGNLEYLNLYGTQVSDAGLENLKGLPRLKKLYLWNSKATQAGADGLKAANPALLVNLGFEPKKEEAPAQTAAAAPAAPAAAINLAVLFKKDGCCAAALAAGKECDHPCCVEARAKGEVCEKCNAGAAAKKLIVAKFVADSCCSKAAAAGKDCDHPCCVEALAKGEVCAKCNPAAAPAAAPAPAALAFDKDSCCDKAKVAGKDCDHPCCVEAKAKGQVCAKCNPVAAKAALVAKFDKDGCCAKAVAASKDCDHPCCTEARAKNEVCLKCNPIAAKAALAAKFDKDGCCAKALAGGKDCDHPCCTEARGKQEVCLKCNPAAAKAALAAKFDKDSCCAKALAATKDCDHPCCTEARAKNEVCTKCNPGAAKTEPKKDVAGGDKVASGVLSFAYNKDIRPILADNCFACHGSDKNARKGDLRLDVRDEAVKHVIVPGDSAASELIQRIRNHDPEEMMPPPATEKKLTDEQIAKVAKWIDEGAVYQPHWAFTAAVRPVLPEVKNAVAVKSPVDNFILGRLEKEGIAPSSEADRVTLIRRLSFDLIGLPPTPAEVDAFVNDSSADAYVKVVDRLLGSPHYGERMAMHWLDLVRYADTNGYHGDEYRSVWPYRDYVVDSFNKNKPYDQFTVEQLAGDLLPNPTREQRVGATYNRLNQLTAEGGAQAKEYISIYAADRVRTASTVWLGTTLGCAQCHDHKFDPFTTKDFYSFSAFFADISEQAVFTAGGNWDPLLPLPSAEQETKLAELNKPIGELQTVLDTQTEELTKSQVAWEQRMQTAAQFAGNDWTPLKPANVASMNGATFAVQPDNSVLQTGTTPNTDIYTVELRVNQRNISGIKLEAIAHPELGGKLSRGNGNFVLTGVDVRAWPEGSPDKAKVRVVRAEADFSQDQFPIANAIDRNNKSGWAVSGHENTGVNRTASFAFEKPVAGGPNTVMQVQLKFESDFAQHSIGCFRISITTVDVPSLGPVGMPAPVLAVLQKELGVRTAPERDRIAKYYRSIAPELEGARTEFAKLTEQRTALQKEIPFILSTVSVEPRVVRVLPRGNWLDESGEIVSPNTPAFLPALNVADRRPSRLDLAQWIVSEQNPLTARVYVNHLWKMYFGTALSKNLDELGNQGEWPLHPELLDWLAVEFRESKWDIKHMVKTIVMSSTYRQSSIARHDLDKTDPYNRLLARQSSFRLSAEQVRDTALRVSGLLSEKLGGPTVKPYQPDGYYSDVNTFTGPLIYDASKGEDQYRRGLYTYWKRSFLHPSLLAFDAPSREECTADRPSSNTPLQALVLLNDPTYLEASRVFAEHILKHGGSDARARLAYAFKAAVGRTPSEKEEHVLMELCSKHMAEFQADKESAAKLVTAGFAPAPAEIDQAELAAWTSVARTILNLHETITRS
jgi:uncharacterized membrane protein